MNLDELDDETCEVILDGSDASIDGHLLAFTDDVELATNVAPVPSPALARLLAEGLPAGSHLAGARVATTAPSQPLEPRRPRKGFVAAGLLVAKAVLLAGTAGAVAASTAGISPPSLVDVGKALGSVIELVTPFSLDETGPSDDDPARVPAPQRPESARLPGGAVDPREERPAPPLAPVPQIDAPRRAAPADEEGRGTADPAVSPAVPSPPAQATPPTTRPSSAAPGDGSPESNVSTDATPARGGDETPAPPPEAEQRAPEASPEPTSDPEADRDDRADAPSPAPVDEGDGPGAPGKGRRP